MQFNNSNQLIEYWETKVKEFEKELNSEISQLSKEERQELCVVEAKKYLSEKENMRIIFIRYFLLRINLKIQMKWIENLKENFIQNFIRF